MDAVNAVVLAVTGLAFLPMLGDMLVKPPPENANTNVQVILGQGVDKPNSLMGGNKPGIALWDRFGGPIGTTFGSNNGHDDVEAGSSFNIKVSAFLNKNNVHPEYMSITPGGDNAICVSAISVASSDGFRTAWTADVAEFCNRHSDPKAVKAMVFESSTKMVSVSDRTTLLTPHCVWIDRDHSNGVPHQGIGIHLPSFGAEATTDLVDSYMENPKLMCNSGPRFRMYEKLRTENPILVFKDPPKFDEDGKDANPSLIINNPGVNAKQDFVALQQVCGHDTSQPGCKDIMSNRGPNGYNKRDGLFSSEVSNYRLHPRKFPSASHAESDIANSTTAAFAPSASATGTNGNGGDKKKPKDPWEGHIVVSHLESNSAKRPCRGANYWGPSIVVIPEKHFCDMSTKTLYQTCDAVPVGACCFNVDKLAVQNCPTAPKPSDPSSTHGKSVVARSETSSSPAPAYSKVEVWK